MSNLDSKFQGFNQANFSSVDRFVDQDKELPTRLVSIFEIEFNPLNQQNDKQEDIELFAEALYEEKQIRSPLNVYKTEDGTFRLLGGERRLKALLLNAERYDDAQRMVPVIVESTPEDEIAEELQILELNEHRSRTPEQIKILVSRYLKIYRALEQRNEKPKGQLREWMAGKCNIGQKKAEEIIHELEGYQRKPKSLSEKDKKDEPTISSAEKQYRQRLVDELSKRLGMDVKDNGKALTIKYKKNEDRFDELMSWLGVEE